MPVLTVKLPDEDRRIAFEPGRSVRDVLDSTDVRVRAGCNGTGACGLCRIRIVDGNGGEPAPNELATIGAGQVAEGVRLACKTRPDQDLRIEVLNPAPPSVWRCLDEESCPAPLPDAVPLSLPHAEHSLGVSVDLGTTHISVTLLDLTSGRRLAGRRGLNPQGASGADVLTRLMAAQSAEQGEKLSRQVIGAIGDGLRDIASRDGIDLQRVVRVVLVGNSAMIALLSLRNHLLLLQPGYWGEPVDCLPVETASWGERWGIGPEAVIEVVPPMAGFVGSDLLAGILATRLTDGDAGALLVDFGTNSEMALWDGKRLWVTSAAGGPAFEGCGIGCGMPADPGAIWRVRAAKASGELSFEVVAGVEPRGVCGSGLVDLLACLVRNGALNRKGQFAPAVPDRGFVLTGGQRELVLTKRDVDIFQRAKAGIGAALAALLASAGMGCRDLRRVCVGGVFGRYLDCASAGEIGLLPSFPGLLVEAAGNTALAGAEAMLLSPEAGVRLMEARSGAAMVNLASFPDFDALFLEHLYLQPMSTV